MFSKIIQYVGTGTLQSWDIEFDPTAAFVFPDGAYQPSIHLENNWVSRTNALGALDSFTGGVRFFGRKLVIGNSTRVNASGAKYRIVVLGAENDDIVTPAWSGNATNGRVINLHPMTATPVASWIKRDNTLACVVKGSGNSVVTDGSVVGDMVTFGAGSLTLTADNNVNQWSPGTGVGEGICGVVFGPGSAVVGQYTGTGTAGSINVGCDASVVLIYRQDGTGVARAYVRGAASNLGKTFDAVAASSGATLINGRLTFTGATSNGSGVGYNYIAIKHRPVASTARRAPAIRVSGKKALSLIGRGTAGYVDFGTGLNINGPITLTWMGHLPGEQQTNTNADNVLLHKVSGLQGSAGAASWGMTAASRVDDGQLSWGGPHMAIITNQVVGTGANLTLAAWRTGQVVPMGIHHHVAVHRGGGVWEYWMDGKLLKQRTLATDSLVSTNTHRITMGARYNGSSYVNPARMMAMHASVYSRALSADEIKSLHARERFGSGLYQDITTGLAERWRAENISGATWAAEVDPTNNGTITAGSVIEL